MKLRLSIMAVMAEAALMGLLLGGCASGTPSGETKTRLPVLADIAVFKPEFQEAARAVAASVNKSGENAKDFHAEIDARDGGAMLVFHLWHKTAFEPQNLLMVGNPGGKCRDVWYDARTHAVTKTEIWQ